MGISTNMCGNPYTYLLPNLGKVLWNTITELPIKPISLEFSFFKMDAFKNIIARAFHQK